MDRHQAGPEKGRRAVAIHDMAKDQGCSNGQASLSSGPPLLFGSKINEHLLRPCASGIPFDLVGPLVIRKDKALCHCLNVQQCFLLLP